MWAHGEAGTWTGLGSARSGSGPCRLRRVPSPHIQRRVEAFSTGNQNCPLNDHFPTRSSAPSKYCSIFGCSLFFTTCFLTPARSEESECPPGTHGSSSRTREGQTLRQVPSWLEDVCAPWPQRVFWTRARVGRTPGAGQRTGEGPGQRWGQERVVSRQPGRGFHGRPTPRRGSGRGPEWDCSLGGRRPGGQRAGNASGWGGRGAFPAHLLALPWPLLAPGPPCPGTEEGWGPARQDHPAPSPLLLRPPHPQAGSGHEILSKTFPLQNNPSKYVFGNRLLIRTGRS